MHDVCIVGPHCVPRRIYSISADSERSELFVAMEGTNPVCSLTLICQPCVHTFIGFLSPCF